MHNLRTLSPALFASLAFLNHSLNGVIDTIETVKSVIVITKAAQSTARKAFPNEEEKDYTEEINQQIAVIQTEEDLNQCIIENARDVTGKYKLPCKCDEPLGRFLSAAGFEKLPEIQEEFAQGVRRLPNETPINTDGSLSFEQKVTIGVIIVVAGAAFVAVPIIAPVIAATAETINELARDAVLQALKNAAQLSTAGKIKVAAYTIQSIQTVNESGLRRYVYKTAEDELDDLQKAKIKKGPLSERIRVAHSKI